MSAAAVTQQESATPQTPSDVRAELRSVVRDVVSELSRRRSGEIARTLARLDLYGLLVSAEQGGVAGSLGSALTVLEELAAAGCSDSYLHDGVLAPSLLRHFDADGSVRELLAGLVAGTRHVAALVDGAADDRRLFDVVGTGAGATLVGTSGPLDAAAGWEHIVALARDGLRQVLALVPADQSGVRFTPGVDPAGRSVTTVVFDAVALAGCTVVPLDSDDVENITSLAALAATARLVGAARRSLELTLKHVRTRQQFGHPLASFQAVQMRCADLARDVDSSACIYRRAVAATEAGRADRHRLASMAAAWAGDACVRATQTAHLLHGALGFTAEFELHRHSITALDARLGASVAFHRGRIARLLLHNSSDRSIT